MKQAGAELCQAQIKLNKLNQLYSAMLFYLLATSLLSSFLLSSQLYKQQVNSWVSYTAFLYKKPWIASQFMLAYYLLYQS